MSQYDVITSGRTREGSSRESAVNAFCEAFKCDAVTAERVLSGRTRALKRGLDEAKAQQYLELVETLGIEAWLASSEAEPAAVPPPTVEPAAVVPSAVVPQTATGQAPGQVAGSYVPDAFRGFEYRVDGRPDFSFLTISLPADASLKVEASAMATMDTNLVMKTKMRGGLGRLITGESMFINEFTAEAGGGNIGIAPGAPGDLDHVYLDSETIYLQNSAFVAAAMEIEIETKWQGLTKGFFSGENLFLIRCSGKGDLWFNTYGGLFQIDVDGGYVVDTGNIVAFTDGLEYKVSKVGGYKSLFFSGEGFVCRFSGKGKVWVQTRDVGALAGWAQSFRRVKKRG